MPKFTFNVFDAIAPGTLRNVEERGNEFDDRPSWLPEGWGLGLKETLFPKKRHDWSQRYGLSDLALRIFLGENTHEEFEFLDNGDGDKGFITQEAGRNSTRSGQMRDHKTELDGWDYHWHENYRSGYGDDAAKINIAAIFNPFNLYRAIDKTISHNGLRLIAHGKSLKWDWDDWAPKLLSYVFGSAICAIGGVFALPRRLAEFVISAPLKPLWNCWEYNIKNKALGKSTSAIGWGISTFFVLVNIALMLTLIGSLATTPMTHIANNIVNKIGLNHVITFTENIVNNAASQIVAAPTTAAIDTATGATIVLAQAAVLDKNSALIVNNWAHVTDAKQKTNKMGTDSPYPHYLKKPGSYTSL